MADESTDPTRHLQDLVERYPTLAPLAGDLGTAFACLRDTFAGGGKLLLCGNGGSAADCEHWAGEMLKGFQRPRVLPDDERALLPAELASVLEPGLPVIPLPALMSVTTAFANDVDARFALAQCAFALGRPGDALVGISTSGDAGNVVLAARAARARGMATVGLTGRHGGRLAAEVDLCLRAPADGCAEVQELHLPIYHCLSRMLEDAFFAPGV